MAETLIEIVLKNLITLVQSEFAAFSGIREKAEELTLTLELIKAILDDAEEKQWSNRPLKVWLQQLKNAMYVMDDILDQLSTQSSEPGCFSSLNPKVIHQRELGKKLNKMIVRLDRIAQRRSNFDLRQVVRKRSSEVAEWRQTSSTIALPQVYGRDEDKKQVVDFLLSPSRSSESLSVYPIVGLGGLGKTTLVQLVYNNQQVANNFDLKIWVCVSENFTLVSILRSILKAMEVDKSEVMNLEEMEKKVKVLLQSKRYLLVLDDVWKRSQEMELGLTQDKWDKLRSVLSCGSKGSSILVSTRDKDVATIMGTCQAHHLDRLSDDACWSLFKLRAFGADKEERAELVAIGKEIVKKCGGSPLAALALGAVMHSRSTEKEWLEVQKSEVWSLPDENDIMPVLRLSYSSLTPTLKQCFAFCAVFPKDTEIEKQELIYLWMGNGFISSRPNLEAEEVGNMVWNELYQKSLFQDVRSEDFSGNIYFKMHDLVHDLAQSISEQECICLEKQNLNDSSRNPHHIVFHDIDKEQFKKRAFEQAESLRTLYHHQLNSDEFPSVSRLIPTNHSLRVLSIYGRKIPSFGSLSCLRYLELCYLDIKSLPASICNLRRLKILKLKDLWSLRRLPKHLTRVQNLRHLIIDECGSLSRMFPEAHKLCDLRTLSVYIVKSEKGHSLVELHGLNLGGKLRIEGLGNVGSISEAEDANLKRKQDLTELSLSWDKRKSVVGAEEVLEALQPHSTLKLLTIEYYEGLHWPTWMQNNSATHNLVSLRLEYCGYCRHLPPLGKLPFLKKLVVICMKDVQYIEEDESYDGFEAKAFPSLEELEVSNLPNMERLLKRETTHMFPSLSKLEIKWCPKLQLPCLPSVKDLTVLYCSNEQLKSISNLNALNQLHLFQSDQVSCFPEGMMNNMTSLATLLIVSFRELKELPSDITKLTALSHLTISNCGKLECLPEQDWEGLSSLRKLSIDNCKCLGSLPNGVRYITSLEYLSISGCPMLKERCKKGTGEDWHKIAHVPHVYLI